MRYRHVFFVSLAIKNDSADPGAITAKEIVEALRKRADDMEIEAKPREPASDVADYALTTDNDRAIYAD